MVRRGNRHLVTTYAPTPETTARGLKKRSAPDCPDYATSCTMCWDSGGDPSHITCVPYHSLITGDPPQISTTPLIRGDPG